MRRIALPVALVICLLPADAAGQATSCPHADSGFDDAGPTELADAVLCLVNAERTARGAGALRRQRDLATVALRHVVDMQAHDRFSHRSSSGRRLAQRVDLTRYLPWDGEWRLGENLRWGRGAESVPRATVAGWLESPAHRQNMLDPRFRDAGVAAAPGAPVPGMADEGAGAYALELGYRD